MDGAITAVRKALILMPGVEEVEGKLRSLEAKATLAKAEADKKAKAAERRRRQRRRRRSGRRWQRPTRVGRDCRMGATEVAVGRESARLECEQR